MMKETILYMIAGLVALSFLGVAASAADVTVDSSSDDETTNGNCTLREALQAANTDAAVDGCASGSGNDTIRFLNTLQGATIRLTLGELVVESDLRIDGGENLGITIDAQGASRILHVVEGAAGQVRGLTLTGGDVAAQGGLGGGIYNEGTLTLVRTTVAGNTAALGGGIYNTGDLTAERTLVENNQALFGAEGGGLWNDASALLTDVFLRSNTSEQDGGGVFNYAGTLTCTRCAFSGNTADDGAALYVAGGTLILEASTVEDNAAGDDGGGFFVAGGALTLTQSTVAGNTAASDGGGIFNDGGTLALTQSTVAGNEAGNRAGGLYARSGAEVIAGGSIVSGNTAGFLEEDLNSDGATVSSLGANLIGATNAGASFDRPTDRINLPDPRLGSLADHGGPTRTMLPLPGSPAVDAGDPSVCGAFETDQRGEGFPRRTDGDGNGAAVCDVGAAEAPEASGTAELVLIFQSPPRFSPSAGSVRQLQARAGGGVETRFDVNGDGVPEKVFVLDDAEGRPVEIAILDGTSNTTMVVIDVPPGFPPNSAPFQGFFEFDGDPDLEILLAEDRAFVLDLDGTQLFSHADHQRHFGVVDINRDGRTDLVLVDTEQRVFQIYGWVGGPAHPPTAGR